MGNIAEMTYSYVSLFAYKTHTHIYIYSNPGQPGKKFVKNDFINQVKFELSTLRHYIYIYTKILEVNLFAFVYRLFHEDISSIIGDFCKSPR